MTIRKLYDKLNLKYNEFQCRICRAVFDHEFVRSYINPETLICGTCDLLDKNLLKKWKKIRRTHYPLKSLWQQQLMEITPST